MRQLKAACGMVTERRFKFTQSVESGMGEMRCGTAVALKRLPIRGKCFCFGPKPAKKESRSPRTRAARRANACSLTTCAPRFGCGGYARAAAASTPAAAPKITDSAEFTLARQPARAGLAGGIRCGFECRSTHTCPFMSSNTCSASESRDNVALYASAGDERQKESWQGTSLPPSTIRRRWHTGVPSRSDVIC